MSANSPIVLLAGLYQNFRMNPSKMSGTLKINEQYGLKMDTEKEPETWTVFVAEKGEYIPWRNAPEDVQKEAVAFISDWEKLNGKTKKDPIDNLKDGGFELGSGAETVRKFEDLSEYEKNATIYETPEISEEEKNRLAREANEKLLAEAEQAQAQEEEELANYDEPEEPEEEVPAVKTGEVKLLDILYDLIEDDLLQIFGHTGTGKTSIAMKAAIEGREAKKSVLYIDTEHNITKTQAAEIKKLGIKYEYIPKFENLYSYVKKIPKYDLVIIDSLGLPVLALFADASMKDKGTALMKMIAMSAFLKNYANDNHSLVIVLNQPESDMNKDPNTERKPFGDKSSYCYKEIISSKFARGGRTEKKTTIVVKAFRSRSCGMGTKLFTVEITSDGVKVIQ